MRRRLAILAFLPLVALATGAASFELTDDEVRRIIVEQSIASYPGPCPCPYSVNRAGRRCGASSAWSKPGGRAPVCYPSDVSAEMIAAFRRRARS